MKRALIVLILLAVVGAVAGFVKLRHADPARNYRFVEVQRGDVEATVESTGALGAVSTVHVGTQVSGSISDLLVDFNDHVKKGQLIARLDPTLLQQGVRQAEADLERSRAALARESKDFERNKRLHDLQLVADSDFNAAQASFAGAQADQASAEAALERARQNLSYTQIYSPIDGIVVERDVDVGQTVAASFSAPQLFLIAEDLSKMQILVSVDESDIGKIHEGQPARFTVEAYPDHPFEGSVRQVRLQSTTTENVVNYTVVVDAPNADQKLLPGMTATVDFLVDSAKDVLTVPNAALRFRPTEEMQAEVKAASGGRWAGRQGGAASGQTATGSGGAVAAPSTERAAEASPSGGRTGAGRHGGASAGTAHRPVLLWSLDDKGKLHVTPVATGITDGKVTVVSGPGLSEGMQIIAGVSGSAASSAPSPFQRSSGGPPRPGGF